MKENIIHIGTSGWSYKHWRGTFYPLDIKIKDHFLYYTKMFNSVEINNTFYGVPSDETFLKWKKQVPENFMYVIKANRFITHLKKLHDPLESLPSFLGKTAFLSTKLGAVLFQLPPSLKIDLTLLETFVAALPSQNRYVFEFRNTTWYEPEVYELLKKYNIAFCIYELAGHISPTITTADFVYLRLHGPGAGKYQGSYSDEALMEWAVQCKKWLETKDVFVYFDNDEKGYAPMNALHLLHFIKNLNTEKQA
mgnify:CR=1 FL=1